MHSKQIKPVLEPNMWFECVRDHEIDPELATPARTILFRDPQEECSEVTNL